MHNNVRGCWQLFLTTVPYQYYYSLEYNGVYEYPLLSSKYTGYVVVMIIKSDGTFTLPTQM